MPETRRSYRAGGADGPFGDPARAHGVPFEGYFWRIVHPSGAVVVALGAACRDAAGTWGLATLAAEPGGFVRTAITPTARAEPRVFGLRAGAARGAGAASDAGTPTLHGGLDRLTVDLGPDARLHVVLQDAVPYPRRAFGALGAAHALPGLPQYWHPVLLCARVAAGRLSAGGREIDLGGATAYAEKNWGRAFPGRWWWGHADFDGQDASVSFAGGPVRLLATDLAPTAVVVRLGRRVLALAPPRHRTRAAVGAGHWRLRTHGEGMTVELEGAAGPAPPLELLVPVPAERRGEPRSHQHLRAELSLEVRRGRRLLFAGESRLAGLEQGVPLSAPRSSGARRG